MVGDILQISEKILFDNMIKLNTTIQKTTVCSNELIFILRIQFWFTPSKSIRELHCIKRLNSIPI